MSLLYLFYSIGRSRTWRACLRNTTRDNTPIVIEGMTTRHALDAPYRCVGTFHLRGYFLGFRHKFLFSLSLSLSPKNTSIILKWIHEIKKVWNNNKAGTLPPHRIVLCGNKI